MFSNIFNWIYDLFLLGRKDNTLIGLSQLRTVEAPAEPVKDFKKSSNIKISDLMRGERY